MSGSFSPDASNGFPHSVPSSQDSAGRMDSFPHDLGILLDDCIYGWGYDFCSCLLPFRTRLPQAGMLVRAITQIRRRDDPGATKRTTWISIEAFAAAVLLFKANSGSPCCLDSDPKIGCDVALPWLSRDWLRLALTIGFPEFRWTLTQ